MAPAGTAWEIHTHQPTRWQGACSLNRRSDCDLADPRSRSGLTKINPWGPYLHGDSLSFLTLILGENPLEPHTFRRKPPHPPPYVTSVSVAEGLSQPEARATRLFFSTLRSIPGFQSPLTLESSSSPGRKLLRFVSAHCSTFKSFKLQVFSLVTIFLSVVSLRGHGSGDQLPSLARHQTSCRPSQPGSSFPRRDQGRLKEGYHSLVPRGRWSPSGRSWLLEPSAQSEILETGLQTSCLWNFSQHRAVE